jgi:hypothetical protein
VGASVGASAGGVTLDVGMDDAELDELLASLAEGRAAEGGGGDGDDNEGPSELQVGGNQRCPCDKAYMMVSIFF